MLTFDEYRNLNPVSQLAGKTIASVGPGLLVDWIIRFTDGDVVELKAHYDDSEVFISVPDLSVIHCIDQFAVYPKPVIAPESDSSHSHPPPDTRDPVQP